MARRLIDRNSVSSVSLAVSERAMRGLLHRLDVYKYLLTANGYHGYQINRASNFKESNVQYQACQINIIRIYLVQSQISVSTAATGPYPYTR